MAIYGFGQQSIEWEAERERLAAQRDRLIEQRANHLREADRCQREYEYTCKQLAQHYTSLTKDY